MGLLTPAERAAKGKAARAEVPRQAHAVFDPPSDRPDPIDLLNSDSTREPDLVAIRSGRMTLSPFSFYRGAALPMAIDLARTPASGLAVQACGDANLSNFGVFTAADRRQVFDIDDFDETLSGPWEWDVKRLAASLEVAARDNGFPGKQRREIVMAAIGQYRQTMSTFAEMGELDVWHAQIDMNQLRAQLESVVLPDKRMDAGLAKAQITDGALARGKLLKSLVEKGRPRIISDPPLLMPINELMRTGIDPTDVEREDL